MGIMSTIIEVLRISKRAMYHLACYVQRSDDIVYGVLRLRDSAKCEKCGIMIESGAHSREETEEPGKIEQLSLW
jgi:hypothetical protein